MGASTPVFQVQHGSGYRLLIMSPGREKLPRPFSGAFRGSQHLHFGLCHSRWMKECFSCYFNAPSMWWLFGSPRTGIHLASGGTNNLERSSSYQLSQAKQRQWPVIFQHSQWEVHRIIGLIPKGPKSSLSLEEFLWQGICQLCVHLRVRC